MEAWVIENCRFAQTAPAARTVLPRPERGKHPKKMDIWGARHAISKNRSPLGSPDARPAIIIGVDDEKQQVEIIPLSSQGDSFRPDEDLRFSHEEHVAMHLRLPGNKSWGFALYDIHWIPMGSLDGNAPWGRVPDNLIVKLAAWSGISVKNLRPDIPPRPVMEPRFTQPGRQPMPAIPPVEQTAAYDWVLRNCRFAAKAYTLRKGTAIYHGTSSPEQFEMLRGPAWVSIQPDVADRFQKWHRFDRNKPRTLSFVLTRNVRLKPIASKDEMEQLAWDLGSDTSDPPGMAMALCGTGQYDGWIVPDNYGSGSPDIMLCSPESCLRPNQYKKEGPSDRPFGPPES